MEAISVCCTIITGFNFITDHFNAGAQKFVNFIQAFIFSGVCGILLCGRLNTKLYVSGEFYLSPKNNLGG